MKQRTVESAKSFIAGAFGPMNLTLKRDDIVSRVRCYIHGLRNCNMSWCVMLQENVHSEHVFAILGLR